MLKVDPLKVFINTSAIIGIGLLWLNLNEKIFKTVSRIAAAPFSQPRKEDDAENVNSSDLKDVDCRCGRLEPGLAIDLKISSPLFNEADMERLERKDFKNVIAEILNVTLTDDGDDAEKTD